MATLRIKTTATGPRFYARWRDGSKYVERPVGPAWVVPAGDKAEKKNGKGEVIGDRIGTWVEKKGNPTGDYLTPDMATKKISAVEEAWAQEQADKAGELTPEQVKAARLRERARELEEEAARVEGDQVIKFRDAAERWYEHRRDIKGLKPSTLLDYRRALDARILPVLGEKALLRLGEGDIVKFRNDLRKEKKPVKEGDDNAKPAELALTPTTINKYLVIIDGILRQACKKSTNGGCDLPSNPATEVEKITFDADDNTVYLRAWEIVAVAAALERGAHRNVKMPAGGEHAKEVNALARKADDVRDAAAVLISGFGGLRRGEVVGLRWRDVSLGDRRLTVAQSIVNKIPGTPKGKEKREVPIAQPVAQALARLDLARREHAAAANIPVALSDDALVFGGALGDALDPVALTIRYRKACRAIGLREVRWHGLRHSFTTMALEGFSADQVQRIVGHKDAATAQNYTHPRSRTTDADTLTRTIEQEIAASPQ